MIGIGIEAMTAEIERARQAQRADQFGALRIGSPKRPRIAPLLTALAERLTAIARPRPSVPPPARLTRSAWWCGRTAAREEVASARRPGRWRECEAARRADRAAPGVRPPAPEEATG